MLSRPRACTTGFPHRISRRNRPHRSSVCQQVSKAAGAQLLAKRLGALIVESAVFHIRAVLPRWIRPGLRWRRARAPDPAPSACAVRGRSRRVLLPLRLLRPPLTGSFQRARCTSRGQISSHSVQSLACQISFREEYHTPKAFTQDLIFCIVGQ